MYTTWDAVFLHPKLSLEETQHHQLMCMCACMHICMSGCMEKSQINRVLNEICTQLRMLRCKIFVVVLLGEPNT